MEKVQVSYVQAMRIVRRHRPSYISRSHALSLLKKDGILLLDSGAKLSKRDGGYYVCGYAWDGRDVHSVLE